MSFLSLFNSGTNVSFPASTSAGSLSAVASGVGFALRGSAAQANSLGGYAVDESLIARGVRWLQSWFGEPAEPPMSAIEAAFKADDFGPFPDAEPEALVETEVESGAREMQTVLPTEISATEPFYPEMTRLQADGVNGNGTYARVTQTLLNGKEATAQGVRTQSNSLTLQSKFMGSGVKFLTGFNPDGFALAGQTSTSSDTFYIVNKNLSTVGSGVFGLDITSGTLITRNYLLQGKTPFVAYGLSIPKLPTGYDNQIMVHEFSVNETNRVLSRTGIYNASIFAGKNWLKKLGDPFLSNPKTFVLTPAFANRPGYFGYVGEWTVNRNTSSVDITYQQVITEGAAVIDAKKTLSSENQNLWVVFSTSNTAQVIGNLSVFEQQENNSLTLISSGTGGQGSIFSVPQYFYLGDNLTPSICRYTYAASKLNCISTTKMVGVQDADLYVLTNAGALQTFNSASLTQTAQLAFPNVASVDAAFPANDGSMFFSSAGTLYKIQNSVPSGTLGTLWNATIPAFVTYNAVPGTTQTIAVNFTSGGNSSSLYALSFVTKATTPTLSSNNSFSFNNELGQMVNFSFYPKDYVQDADRRTFRVQSGIAGANPGFTVNSSSPISSGLTLSNVTFSSYNSIEKTFFSNASNELFLTVSSNLPGAPTTRLNIIPFDSNQPSQPLYDNISRMSVGYPDRRFPCVYAATFLNFQSNLTTFCPTALNGTFIMSLTDSKILPLGEGNATYSLASFALYPMSNNLLGIKAARSGFGYYWAIYNISIPDSPQLVFGSDGFPFTTPSNMANPSEKFDQTYPLWNDLYANELGHIFQWESPFNVSNPRWQKLAQLPVPSSQSALYEPYAFIDNHRFIALITNAGRLNIFDLSNPKSPLLAGDYGDTVQYATMAISADQKTVALLDVTHMLSVFSLIRFSDETFGLSLLSKVQTPLTTTINRLYFPPNHNNEIWKIPVGQVGPSLYRITPPSGRWDPGYGVSIPVTSLGTKTVNIPLTDGLGRNLNFPVTITGTPLAVVPVSPDLINLGDKKYALVLSSGGISVFSPGSATPKFDIDLNVLFSSPNTAYVPGTYPTFFFQEATIPSYVTIFDRGSGKYSLQIVGGIFPPQAVNQRPDGSLIENSQEIILQVGDTLGSSGIDLHLKIQIRGNVPRMEEAFFSTVTTGQKLKDNFPAVVTGVNSHGFPDNTDGLETCYEARNLPTWVVARCAYPTGTMPLNTVGTTSFEVRPRTYIPGTGQLVGVGEWQTATVLNPGQGFLRPLGDLLPAGTSQRVKVGVPTEIQANSPSGVIFRNADGSYPSTYVFEVTGADRVDHRFSAETGKLTLLVRSSAKELTATLKSTQPSIYQSPETATVSTVFTVESSLTVELRDEAVVTEGTLAPLPIQVSMPSIADMVDLSVTFSPVTGSALNSVIQVPAEFLPYLDSSTPVIGKLSLKQIPVSLLTKTAESGGISTYRLELSASLAEGQNQYWNAEVTAQDYVAGEIMNAAQRGGQTLVVNEKPRAAEVNDEATLLSNNQLAEGTTTRIRMDGAYVNSAGGKVTFSLQSSNENVVSVGPRKAESVFGDLHAKSPGHADITACMTNRFNLTTCKTPERVTVPDPKAIPPSSKSWRDQLPGISTAVSVGGSMLMVTFLVILVVRSRRKHQQQSADLVGKLNDSMTRRTIQHHLPRGKGSVSATDYQKAVEQAFQGLSRGMNPIPAMQSVFQNGLALLRNKTMLDQKIWAHIKKLLREEMPPVIERNNPPNVANALMLLLCFTTILAGSRTDLARTVNYVHRNKLLHWVDDQVSLVKGKTAEDYLVKALLKLIRSTVQPLKTNETLLHNTLAHLAGVVGTLLKLLKSRRHQGDFEHTMDVVMGMVAWSNAGSTTHHAWVISEAQKLLSRSDWRLRTLGLLALKASSNSANALEPYSTTGDGSPSSPKSPKKSASCFSRYTPKTGLARTVSRTALIATVLQHQRSDVAVLMELAEEDQKDTPENGGGSPGHFEVINPLRTGKLVSSDAAPSATTRQARVSVVVHQGGSRLAPPPPPPPPPPLHSVADAAAGAR